MVCPLCRCSRAALDGEAHGRRFFRCSTCELTFVDARHRLDRESELAHYGTHQNDVRDARYRNFLSRLTVPLVERLPAGSEGLDYGSGPAPALAEMLREQGFRVEIYDPFFAPGPGVLRRDYDFVTASEVVEHFFSPREEFERLDGMIRPGGWLGIMTEPRSGTLPLQGWRYARDPTHVSLYAPATLQWLAQHFGWTVEFSRGAVSLFRKPAL
jgi:hypothetical protein